MKDENKYSVDFEYKDGSVDEAADNVEDIIKNALDGEAEEKVLKIYKNLKGGNTEDVRSTVIKASKGAKGLVKIIRAFVILVVIVNVLPTILFGVLTSIPEEKIESVAEKIFESDIVKNIMGLEEGVEIEDETDYAEIEGGDRIDKAHGILNSDIWNEDSDGYEEVAEQEEIIKEHEKKEEKTPLIDTDKLKKQVTNAALIALVVIVVFIGVLLVFRSISIKKSKQAFGTINDGLESDSGAFDEVEK